MKRFITIIISIVLVSVGLYGQENENQIVMARIVNMDTLITINLPEYCTSAKLPRKLKRMAKKHNKLVRNVKKVYPYAKLAGMKLNEYEEILTNAESEKERKALMKQAEQELKDEFEEDLKKLTFSQGLILIKLVDRETGNSSYVLVQELRGNFVAFFWQTFARLFGYNLKIKYDPEGDDKAIEEIVQMIEKGEL